MPFLEHTCKVGPGPLPVQDHKPGNLEYEILTGKPSKDHEP